MDISKKIKEIARFYFDSNQDFFCEFLDELKEKETVEAIEDEKISIDDPENKNISLYFNKQEMKELILVRIDILKEKVIEIFNTNEIWQ